MSKIKHLSANIEVSQPNYTIEIHWKLNFASDGEVRLFAIFENTKYLMYSVDNAGNEYTRGAVCKQPIDNVVKRKEKQDD